LTVVVFEVFGLWPLGISPDRCRSQVGR